MQVVEPLKDALVDKKNKPDYSRLQAVNRELQGPALETCRQWKIAIGHMCDEIMSKSLKNLSSAGSV